MVQHRVRKRNEARAKAIVSKTVGRMILSWRLSGYWLGVPLMMFVGILVDVVSEVAGHFEGSIMTVVEDNVVAAPGFVR